MAWYNRKKEKSDIEVKVDQVISQLESKGMKANASEIEGFRAQIAKGISGGYDFADTLHNIYYDFGYPAQLDFDNFWNMYRRFGLAKNVVDMPVNTGWSTFPTIESTPQLERDIETLETTVKLWMRIKALDTRQRVGRYAGLYMRVRDNKRPSEPIEGKLNGLAALVSLVPLYESQLEITSTDADPMSDTFGQPLKVEYRSGVDGDRNEDTNGSVTIDASRIVFASEGADTDEIYGIPSLEAVYNSLLDLRKIIGAGGEGFYKNAAQSIVFNLKDTASALGNADKLSAFNDQYDDFSRNRSRRAMWTPGMDATTLESSLANPKEFFVNALNDVAAGSGIPASILIGAQTGVLAGNNDTLQYMSTMQSRRENFMTDMTRSVLDWMMEFGILPTAEYEVVWDDLLARSDNEKLDNSLQMADINSKQVLSGGDLPFSGEEIREAAGFTPEELPEPEGEEIIDDEDAE